MAAPHGGGDEALQQVALPRYDQREADAPHACAHEVHPEQARHQEIDVARARLGQLRVPGGEGVRSPRGALQCRVHRQPRGAALGLGGIVGIDRGIVRRDDEHHLAAGQRLPRLGVAEQAGLELGPCRERRQPALAMRPGRHGDGQRFGWTAAEGQAQDGEAADEMAEGEEFFRRHGIVGDEG